MAHEVSDGDPAFSPLLRTKLCCPQLDAELVNRDRLIEGMNGADEMSLILVSAPAGYGKSVLVAQWVARLDRPVAWLSLDASDSDLRVFLRYFIAAVDTVSPGACGATGELLKAGSLAPVPVLADYLLNDLHAIDAPCTIVLDDYHRIEALSPVHDLMVRMLEHPPPQFRFVVLSRQDPPFDLPSLRAGHRMNEVRLRDLRFTRHETSEFLGATGPPLPMSDEALADLEREVEGWAAGLRLVSLALRNVDDTSAFFENLHGRLPQSQEYLLREVLAAESAQVRERMLASCILDRFCAGLLDAVCEPAESADHSERAGERFLEHVRKSNLFTISLDSRSEWFRFHHLFQQLLVSELERLHGPDQVVELHLRASEWFEGEGLIDEALKHALAADEMERAIQLISKHRHAALNADRWDVLERWLSLIPPRFVQQHAALLIARGWILLDRYFRVDLLPPLLDQVESLLGDEPGMGPIHGEVALCRGYILFVMGDGAESLKHLEIALEKIPVSHLEVRSIAEVIFAEANQMLGQKEQGMRFLDDLLAYPDSMEELRKTRLLTARVIIHVTAGDLLEAELANRGLWEAVERGPDVYVLAWANYLQGLIHLLRCEWKMAVEYLERSVAMRFIHHRRAAVDSITGLMLAYQALGEKDKVWATMQILHEYVASLVDSAMDSLVISAEARLALLQGRSAPATRWLEATGLPPEGALLYWFDVASVTRCRAMIAAASADSLAQAEARLKEHAEANESNHNIHQLIRILTLLAMACERQGKTKEGLGILERAVTMARRGDLFFPFVELGKPMVELLDQLTGEREFTARVERLVTAFGAPTERFTAREAGAGDAAAQRPEGRRAVAGRNLEGLTNRELEILELLARRLQNKEIAARLQISHQTVNSHLKQIYHKLGVHGRRKAVERAVAVGLLDRSLPNTGGGWPGSRPV